MNPEWSSDLEFDAPPPRPRLGQASIDKIIESAEADRISSKRTAKQLQFGSGAPRTILTQRHWADRFDEFRHTTVQHNDWTVFQSKDLVRFFDVIVGVYLTSILL